MFAAHSRKTIPLPFEPPHPQAGRSITIHKLTGRDLERAESEHLAGTLADRNPRGWALKFKQLLAKGTATEGDALKTLRDPLAGYDRLTVAQCGVKAWTCVDLEGKPIACTAETIADCDDEALEFMATEVMRLTKPHLFETSETAGDERKNG